VTATRHCGAQCPLSLLLLQPCCTRHPLVPDFSTTASGSPPPPPFPGGPKRPGVMLFGCLVDKYQPSGSRHSHCVKAKRPPPPPPTHPSFWYSLGGAYVSSPSPLLCSTLLINCRESSENDFVAATIWSYCARVTCQLRYTQCSKKIHGFSVV